MKTTTCGGAATLSAAYSGSQEDAALLGRHQRLEQSHGDKDGKIHRPYGSGFRGACHRRRAHGNPRKEAWRDGAEALQLKRQRRAENGNGHGAQERHPRQPRQRQEHIEAGRSTVQARFAGMTTRRQKFLRLLKELLAP